MRILTTFFLIISYSTHPSLAQKLGVKWGMTKLDIIKLEEGNELLTNDTDNRQVYSDENLSILHFKNPIINDEDEIIYLFSHNLLVSYQVVFDSNDKVKELYFSDFNEVKSKLISKYGDIHKEVVLPNKQFNFSLKNTLFSHENVWQIEKKNLAILHRFEYYSDADKSQISHIIRYMSLEYLIETMSNDENRF